MSEMFAGHTKQVGPFMGVSKDETVEKMGKNFRIVLYCAYNACGLIGPEMNGVAVLDEDKRQVIADGFFQEPSGYSGPTKKQKDGFDTILKMKDKDFKEYVNASERCRTPIP